MSDDIPRFLCSDLPVNNRRMGRSQMEEIVAGYWEYRSMKMVQDTATESVRPPLDVLLYEYLLEKNNGKDDKAIEDGYNFNVSISPIIDLKLLLD